MKQTIMLIGFMGTGKSTVSRKLHELAGLKETDLDAYIEKKAGCKISEIFEKQGETAFRDLETRYLRELLEESSGIISCGGGTVLRSGNVACMKEHGRIVLLTAQPDTIYKRVRNSTSRPVLNGHMNVEYIEQLMEARREAYERAADLTIPTDFRSVEDICGEILKKCSISVKNS